MRRLRTIVLLLILTLFCQTAAQAAITIIDDFTSVAAGSTWPLILPGTSSPVYSTESGLSDVLGGQRYLLLSPRSDLPAVGQSVAEVMPTFGTLNFTTNQQNFSSIWLEYTGDFDLSDGFSINVDFVSTTPLMMSVLIGDAFLNSTVTRDTTGDDLVFPLSDYSSALDLSHIRHIVFVMGGQQFRDPGGAFVIDSLTINSIGVVPEPASLAIWSILISIVAVQTYRRRRNSQAG